MNNNMHLNKKYTYMKTVTNDIVNFKPYSHVGITYSLVEYSTYKIEVWSNRGNNFRSFETDKKITEIGTPMKNLFT